MLRIEVATMAALLAAHQALAERADPRSDQGEVTSTTIMIAVLATLALAVGVILTAKVTSKANSIPTN